MPPRTVSSGMGERKKRTTSALPLTSVASSSSASHRQIYQGNRSPSPPASAYFPLLSANGSARLRPTPDADAHFAYSTTLRRHPSEASALASPAHLASAVNAEAQSLWSRAVGYVTGRRSENDYGENGRVSPATQREPQSNTASAQFAHTSVEDTIAHFRTSSENGLLHSDIPNLLATHGYNEFSVSSPEPVLIKFAKTIYESPLILLLCGSASVSAIMGNIDDAISITVAVLIVLTVGFVQERRSEKSLEALNKLVPHHCHVLRYVDALLPVKQ